MSWPTDAIAEQNIAQLLIAAIVAAVFGIITSYLTYHFIKRKEIIDTIVADIQKQNIIVTMETEKQKEERIRIEITRWANPILGAVQELEARLNNILEYGGHPALSENYNEDDNPRWSISYNYFMHSSLYIFAQYFCWIRILQESLNFELFQTQHEKREFFDAVRAVSKALGDYPPNYGPGDRQLFRLQQRAIGEQMIVQNGTDRLCISYPEFIKKLDEDQSFRMHIDPLRSLLEDLNPSATGRWRRLKIAQKELGKLNTACNDLLSYK